MKKRIQIILFMCTILIGSLMCLTSCTKNQELRIRIRPNDNSLSSLNIKQFVKEDTLILLKNSENMSINELVDYLYNNLSQKYDNLLVEYKKDIYPLKTMDGKLIPSGEYPTILITIGSGLGDNWWSILYPEYFGLDYESSDEVEYRSYFYDLIDNKSKNK